jgi:ribosomal protein S18 acetylase RimI-like enzyme
LHTDNAIRRAHQDDVASIAALVHDAYAPYIPRIGREPAPMLDDYSQVVAQSETFVLINEGRVVGVLVMILEGGELLLENIAVATEYKGKGGGKRLLTFCEGFAASHGCGAVRLYTHERMVENIEIYKKTGYQETHRATENGFARVFMRKVLRAD